MEKALNELSSAELEVLERFKIPYEQLDFGDKDEVLGKGSFGIVKVATFFNERVAVKQLVSSPHKDMSEVIVTFFDEVRLMAPLHHANIIDCYGGCWNSSDLIEDRKVSVNSFRETFTSIGTRNEAHFSSKRIPNCLVLELGSFPCIIAH